MIVTGRLLAQLTATTITTTAVTTTTAATTTKMCNNFKLNMRFVCLSHSMLLLLSLSLCCVVFFCIYAKSQHQIDNNYSNYNNSNAKWVSIYIYTYIIICPRFACFARLTVVKVALRCVSFSHRLLPQLIPCLKCGMYPMIITSFILYRKCVMLVV